MSDSCCRGLWIVIPTWVAYWVLLPSIQELETVYPKVCPSPAACSLQSPQTERTGELHLGDRFVFHGDCETAVC
jgi:hypothetical protein